MNIRIRLNTEHVKGLIMKAIEEKLDGLPFDPKRVLIEVKSKQNFRVHEWEVGDIQASYEVDTL